ncbi:FdhF/YdeP family oxidoreductase [Fimbriimonas ginsengisoli]|uniref:Putative Molybdopterin oxidoreductase n=1 Tax=Fimbriimonas ginsengisoli Gsoil 348 TaxID=661478 RepID=A0A068NVW4_FIMGI|nr:FdhF/YdeP family oxidoreductase [Fimbriimonas ginsengisoli]AIE86930.1 putative Molybdopterin oxidoreductase [Fimbriimonas ginsengisoli Gsoil 348]
MRKVKSGGGWQAVRYGLRKAQELGPLRFYRALSSRNACKTCALGMGGQLGGMRNEAGRFPEVCKKSFQAMAADMQGRIEPRFFETYSIDQLKGLSSRELEMCGRIVDPLIAGPGDTHYRVATWDEALDLIGGRLKDAPPERSFFYCSGRSSNEAGFLLNLLARAYGTNHISNCSYYCHQASGVGLTDSLGTGTSTVALEDVEHCDMLFLIGGNPASNHPRLMTLLMKLRSRGGKVIVVNPVKETGLVNFKVPSNVVSMLFGTEIASGYLQPTIGGDIALFAGMAKRLIERDAVSKEYISEHTLRYEEVRQYVASLTWEEVEAASGLSRAQVQDVADQYAKSKRAIFSWTMGITHHEHGVENVQWIVNLALLRGMIGKDGAGVMPIRGHSNVQGLGSVGVSPILKKAALERLETIGLKSPDFSGHDTLAAMEAGERGEMDFGLCLGGNLYGANPDSNFAAKSLGQLEVLVYMNTTLNTGHAHGLGKTTVILPVLARDEEPQSTTQESMFNYVRLSDGGPARHEGPRSEVAVLADIAFRALGEGGPLDWSKLHDHDEIRKLIARLVPGFEELESIGETKREFHIPGRILHEPKFPTPSGRALFRAHPIPKNAPLGERQLRLMTVRSEGQFNSVVYEEQDIYRGQERRDVILMNARDIERLDLHADQPVTVRNEVGTMRNIVVRPFDIAEGCALMYYPEANVLVPRKTDPRSRTPAFKAAVVTVEPSTFGTMFELIRPGTLTSHQASSRDRMKSC